MKKKTLIIATMVAAMVALAGCGKEETPEEKFKNELQNAMEEMEEEFEDFMEKAQEKEEASKKEEAPTIAAIPHLRAAFPEITIGNDISLEKKAVTGEALMIENRVSFTIPEDWVLSSTDRAAVYYDYKDNNAPIEASVSLDFLYDKATEGISYISRDAFEQKIIDAITFHQGSTSDTVSNLTHININGYDGYCFELNHLNASFSDSTCLFVYLDGCYLQLNIAYFDATDPAIKEEAIASAMEVISTLTPIERAE